jgi:sugar lactone lactonase YvrE
VVRADGTLLNIVERFWPTGAIVAAPGLINPVGMTLDAGGSNLYIADAGDDMLKQFAFGGFPVSGVLSDVVSLDYQDTEPASGIVYDGLGNVFSVTGTGSATVTQTTVFPVP